MMEVKEQRSLINLCLDLVELDPTEQENQDFIAKRLNQLGEKVDGYVAMDKFADQQIDNLKLEAERIHAMIKRFEAVQDGLRDRAMVALQTLGKRELKSDSGHKMSIRKTEIIDVKDASTLPDWAVKVTVTRAADKTALKAALKDGDKIYGVSLIEREYVVFR
jgi:hypothetical protein